MLWIWMLNRIVANPISNVFQKSLAQRGLQPLAIVCLTHGLLTLVCLPTLLFLPIPKTADFWINIGICTVLNIAGNTLLVQAVRLSDLSVVGPINAYKPVVSLLPSLILLREVPQWLGLAGILLILIGSYFLADKGASSAGTLWRLWQNRGVQYRFGALLATSLEAVFLKRVIQDATPWMAFALWSILGFFAALFVVLIAGRYTGRKALKFSPALVVLSLSLALTTGLMQFSTIIILKDFQVGYALALFQISAVISVVLGHRIFQEPHLAQRLAGSLVMAAGAALIIVGG